MMRSMLLILTAALLAAPAPASAQEEVVYYHTDAIGSVRAITDHNGDEIARYDYLPFGELWPTDPPQPNERRQFAGKERDFETTGLDYFGARYHRPVSGRFTTVDPVMNVEAALVDPQRWNRYAYVHNRPFTMVDPDGREAGFIYLPNGQLKGPYRGAVFRNDTGAMVAAAVLVSPFVAAAGESLGLLSIGRAIGSAALGWVLRNPQRAADLVSDAADIGPAGGALPSAGTIRKFSRTETEGLRTLFGNSRAGADNLLARLGRGEQLALPEGVTRGTLLNYRAIARLAIAQGKDTLGVQQQRLDAIERLLEREYR